MPKTTGLGDNFYIAGFDLSGDIASVDKISAPIELLEVTALSAIGHSRLAGKRDGAMSFTTFLDVNNTVATPAVPASTVTAANNTGQTVLVTITGGTLSSVKINGVQVGTTAGTYVLPDSGNTISITYTVAPTWAWFALGTEHNALASIPSADQVATYFRGTVIGNPAACMVSKQSNYDPTRDTNGNITIKVDLVANAFGMEWGLMVTPGLRTDIAATTGTFIDQGAGTTFGCQAYLQIVELVGTNVDVTITHCTTSGGSYTSLIDFGSQTAIGGFRQATANNVTVNEFLKVNTTGTFSYVTFAVVFCRNAIAGVAF